jgi:CDP-glucose 4,6-dehydratase
MDLNFWKNKKIFITGSSGFKGSWLTFWLIKLGAKVCGYSLSNNENNLLFNGLKIEKNSEQIFADIRNFQSLKQSINEFKPEIVIHMAAQSLVRESFENPIYTFETNIIGTANLLEVSKQLTSIKSILVITSDKCYENIEKNISYKETDKMGGHDPYSASKGCAEIVAGSYYRSYFKDCNDMGLATARAGNVIGGGDWATDRLIPDFIRALENKSTLEIRYPNSLRPWQHVLEPLRGYLMLIEKQYENKTKFSGAWNFGPYEENTISVKRLIDNLNLLIKNKLKINYSNKEEYHEAGILKLDSSKASKIIKWGPLLNLDETLMYTMEWYLAYLDNEDIELFTLNQINKYEEAMHK